VLFALFLLLAAPAPAQNAPVSLRVLVQNIYGRREKDCEARYRALAEHVLAANPPFDLVAFNEHWKVPLDPYYTCDADVLTRAMENDGRYAGAGKSVQHVPRGSGISVSGGDSIFTLRRITKTTSGAFSNSNRFPKSGYVLARTEVAPGVSVDFWDAHFEALSDKCSDSCRAKQGKEFAAAIKKEASGNPVLLVGDYNTGGPLSKSEKPPYAGNGGYDDLMKVLGSPVDVWLELGSGLGYTYDCGTNHTQQCTERERIDYVLVPDSPAASYALVPKSIAIVKWTTPAGNEISDHYGLDATLELVRKSRGASVFSKEIDAFSARLSSLKPRFDGRE
jgi:endonuclease/exonuclease/phosphatase family metal-dependent hydrolase